MRWPSAILDRRCARQLMDGMSRRRNRPTVKPRNKRWIGWYQALAGGRSAQGVPRAMTALTWINSLRAQATMALVCDAPRARRRPCSAMSGLFQ